MKDLVVSSLFYAGVVLTSPMEMTNVQHRTILELHTATTKNVRDICIYKDIDGILRDRQTEPTKIVSIDTKLLKKSPLARKGISPTLSNLLGQNQSEHIIDKYNSELKKKNKNSMNLTYSKINELRIPLIFDELKNIFPKDIQTFLDKNSYLTVLSDQINNPCIFVVKRESNGKYALAYYNDGILQLATHASTGKKSGSKIGKNGHILPGGIGTPEGSYFIQYKEKNKSSHQFENAPMSYALNIKDGIFIHTGTTDGTPLSHGCIRIPGLYAQQLFGMVQKGTHIIISFIGIKESMNPEKGLAIVDN